MIPLEHLIAATDAELQAAGAPGPNITFTGFSHDSRAVGPGECFVAVRGIHGDGHDYLRDAVEHGATGLLVERAKYEALPAELREYLRQVGTCVLAVADTRAALRAYASYILALWHPTVIAVTGSTGKTTTKEAIADVLGLAGPTFRSWRNYNDALGLPLSLGKLQPDHRFAVLELGADHPGEIRDLCAMVRPTVGVVTNVSPTHLDYFGTVDALAAEMTELPAALPADGLAILNHDDETVRAMASRTQARVRYFGLGDGEHVDGDVGRYRLMPVGSGKHLYPGSLELARAAVNEHGEPGKPIPFASLHGDHWAGVILAAVLVAGEYNISERAALDTLGHVQPLPGRMRQLPGRLHMLLFDDTHNATPASAAAGLAWLTAYGTAYHYPRIAVLGDMLRLGTLEAEAHEELGRQAAASTDFLVTQGTRAERTARAAIRAGMPADHVAITHTDEDAADAVRRFAETITDPATAPLVYVKGSEEMRMERVVARLLTYPNFSKRNLDRQTETWQRAVVMRPDRPTWLEIDLSAIGQNMRRVKEIVGEGVRVLISLKADAYGHGALRVARTALNNGAEWLGVATVSEAEPLRMAGITAPILIFGYTAPWQAREAVRLDLRANIYSLESARALSQAAQDLGREVRVHVKVDTGMARLGLRAEEPEAIAAFCAQVRALPGVVLEGIFTHFATADSADQTYARRQLERFNAVLAALAAHGIRPELVHAANSAATLTLPEAHFDMVRTGVAIYGLDPSDEVRLPEGFRPVLSFKTQVAQVKWIPAGEGIGYGATYITARPTRIAVLPVGYADGFRRAPMNWGEVLVRGQRAPLIGRVSMDQCVIDVTGIPGVSQGDEVVLLGRQGDDVLTAEAVARRLGTISYEVVAELLARVPRMS